MTVQTLLPAPQIIELTATVPELVAAEIRRASKLVWLDPPAAVGALRSAAERVMDNHDIPTKNTKGGWISLHSRLEIFKEVQPSPGTLLEAAKWVGNDGIHDPTPISTKEALETAQFVEHALREIYPQDDSEIRSRAAQININRGLRRQPPSGDTDQVAGVFRAVAGLLEQNAGVSLGRVPCQGDLLRSTVEFCAGRVAEDSIYGVLHRECGRLFPDVMFADLFTDVGRRSVPLMIVAVVMVLQRIEGLSDREAVERFAFDARWKYAAGGLDFDYPGFVYTVLVGMRARLALGSPQPHLRCGARGRARG